MANKMKSLFLVFCLVLLAQGFQGMRIQNARNDLRAGQSCDANAIYQISSFSVASKPVKGQNADFTMTGVMSQTETITGLVAFAKWNGISVLQQNIEASGTVSAGQSHTIQASVFLTDLAPSGPYTVQLKVKNSAGQYISCWEYGFTL